MDDPREPQVFDQEPTIDELARRQGVVPVMDPDVLLGDFWPEDESIDDFLAARRVWSKEGARERSSK